MRAQREVLPGQLSGEDVLPTMPPCGAVRWALASPGTDIYLVLGSRVGLRRNRGAGWGLGLICSCRDVVGSEEALGRHWGDRVF